jgi:hypothetical protein
MAGVGSAEVGMTGKEQSPLITALSAPLASDRRINGIHFVRRFETLTGIRLRSATVASLPREFLGRPTLAPEEIARRYCYQLQPRTYNALRRYGTAVRHSPWTFGRLLEIRGFGLFCLLDLLEVLANPPADNDQ